MAGFISCAEEMVFTPKPRAYPRIEFPRHEYRAFDKSYCNFTFEYPTYAAIEQDTLFFDEKPVDPCWFDIYIAQFNCRIHCSYYPINSDNTFEKLNNDAFELTNKHVTKAEYINPTPVQNIQGVYGFTFNLEGPVATPFQFFLTDSTRHFLRGAMYFHSKSQPDSLSPIIDFVKEDIDHMIKTFRWLE